MSINPEDPHVQYSLKSLKRNTFTYELSGVGLLAGLVLILGLWGVFPLPDCAYPVLNWVDLEYIDLKKSCQTGQLIEIASYLLLPYLFALALLISSPLRAGPVMAMSGVYLCDKESGARPNFKQAFLYTALHPNMLAIYIGISGFAWFDFAPPLYWVMVLAIVFFFFTSCVQLYDHFRASRYSYPEDISGLRLELSAKKQEKKLKELGKNNWHLKRTYPLRKLGLGLFLSILISGFLLVNILRGGAAPANYQEVLYKRPAVSWESNAYFAFKGLNAPADIENSYLFGKEATHFLASKWAQFKSEIGLSTVHSVPDLDYTLFEPEHKYTEQKLEFNAQLEGIQQWDCLYSWDRSSPHKNCPDIGVVEDLIAQNQILWERFQKLKEYNYLRRPDFFFNGSGFLGDLIGLSRLNSAYLLWLQSQGREEEAMRDWLQRRQLMKQAVESRGVLPAKASYLIIFGMQINELEFLLYNHPQLAIQYNRELKNSLDSHSIRDFAAHTMIADDWGNIAPIFLPYFDWSNHHRRQLYQCFLENEKAATKAAHEIDFEQLDICSKLHSKYNRSNGFFLRALIQPGEPVTNIIAELLKMGVLTGDHLIKNMYSHITVTKMARVALHLITNDIKPEAVEAFLQTLPEDLNNPITQEPFLWDKKNQALYYVDPSLQGSKREFHVNLTNRSSRI